MITLNPNIAPEVQRLDLSQISVKLLKENESGFFKTTEVLDIAQEEYLKLLTLILRYPGIPIVPTKLVDAFWHQHILDTRAYQSDCDEVFREFIHHFPYFGMWGKEDEQNLKSAFAHTCTLYEKEFGMKLEDAYASRCEGHACHVSTECACRVSGACKPD